VTGLRLAYADPPYYGSCRRYGHHHEAPYGCWDDLDTHRVLIDRLGGYDGWALSCTSNSLRHLLPMCPDRVRVLAWVKPFAIFKKYVSPAYAWEPVLVKAARKPAAPKEQREGRGDVPKDWLLGMNQQDGFRGGKPLVFCRWVFTCMGADRGDTIDDIFPGSGAVKVAWEHYRTHLTLFPGDRPEQSTFDLGGTA
jgi:hypothetical protein